MERDEFTAVEHINDTADHPGRFGAITALAAAVLASGTVATDYTGNAIAGMPIPAGTTIYGTFTNIKLTSGTVVAYEI
jgi:hypothetical protein